MTSLSAADLRRRSMVPEVTRVLGPPDLLDQAVQIKKAIVANAMLDQASEEQAATAARARAERMKADNEVAELEKQRKEPAGGGFSEYILEEMRRLNASIDAVKDEKSQAYLQSLAQQMNALHDEISHLRATEPDGGGNALSQALAIVGDAKALVDAVTPPSPPPSVGREDPALQAYRLRLEADREDKRRRSEEEREERREARLQEQAGKNRELDLLEQRQQRMDRFIADTAPRLLELGNQLLSAWTKQPPGNSATAQTDTRQLELPEGVQVAECAQCHTRILYRETWPGFICQGCGTEWEVHAEEEQVGRPDTNEGLM